MLTSLFIPLRLIGKQVYLLIVEIIGYASAFREKFECTVTAEIEKARKLSKLSSSDFHRIRPVLYEAASCYHSVRLWPIFKLAIRRRKAIRAKIAITLAAALIITYAASSIPWPTWGNLNATGVLAAICSAEVLYIFTLSILALLPDPGPVIGLAAVCTMSFVIVDKFKKWSSYPQPIWHHLVYAAPLLHQKQKIEAVRQPIAPSLQLTLWLIALASAIALTLRYVRFLAKMTKSPLEMGLTRSGQQCAEVIIDLVHIAHFADDLIQRIEVEFGRQEDGTFLDIEKSWIPLSNKERSELNGMLASLATLVRRRWAPAVASGHGMAGQWLASHGSRIEFFIRRQQLRNLLLGNNLFELRDELTSTLVHAADGDWHLIGANENVPSLRVAARWRRALRRALGIAAPLVAAVVADHFMKHISGGYLQTIIFACITFAAVQILYVIDPDAPGRFDVAGKFAGVLKRN